MLVCLSLSECRGKRQAGDADSGDDEMKDARRYDKDSLTSYEYKLDPEEFEDEEIDEVLLFAVLLMFHTLH